MFFKVTVIFIIFSSGLPAMGQAENSIDGLSHSNPRDRNSLFIKAGGGVDFAELTFTKYNRPTANGIPPEVDTSQSGINHIAGSIAWGIDFPDSFSLFASCEWFAGGERYAGSQTFPSDWGVLANAQYTFGHGKIITPYLYWGVGMDFSGGALGPVFQGGLGAGIPFRKNIGIYVEAKLYAALVYFANNLNPALGFRSFEIFSPVLLGVKYNL